VRDARLVPDDLSETPVIRLTIPASSANLRLARLVAASLAADLEFDVEEIEDVRVAVDELAAMLLREGGPQGLPGLSLEFTAEGGVLLVRGEGEAPEEGDPEVHAVAAELLGLLTDSYACGRDGSRWWFEMRRTHRGDAAGG